MSSDYLMEKGSVAKGSQICGLLVGDSLLMLLYGNLYVGHRQRGVVCVGRLLEELPIQAILAIHLI